MRNNRHRICSQADEGNDMKWNETPGMAEVANNDSGRSYSSGFGWRARERMQRTGVHAFNLPVEDLMEITQSHHEDAIERIIAPNRHEPQRREEIPTPTIDASVTSKPTLAKRHLAAAEVDLQAARVELQNAYLKERMKALRAVAATAERKLASDIDLAKSAASEAIAETRVAQSKVDELSARVKEMRKVLQRLTGKGRRYAAAEDAVVGNNSKLLSEINAKILDYWKQS